MLFCGSSRERERGRERSSRFPVTVETQVQRKMEISVAFVDFLVYRRRHPESKGGFVNYWAVRIAKHGQRRLNSLAIPDAESQRARALKSLCIFELDDVLQVAVWRESFSCCDQLRSTCIPYSGPGRRVVVHFTCISQHTCSFHLQTGVQYAILHSDQQ